MKYTHVFFDLGGVLGTNGWDHEQRYAAIDHFGLAREEFEYRHRELVGPWEEGRIGMWDYLEATVFHEPRTFGHREFVEYMLELSKPNVACIAIAAELSRDARIRLMTMNNESSDLNTYRIARFGLSPLFVAFFSSCWLGIRKPVPLFFTRCLSLAQADPRASLFIDDRPQNVQAAQSVGIDALHFTDPAQLRAELASRDLLLSFQPSESGT